LSIYAKGKIIWAIALPMAANAFGGWLGANWPLRKETALSEYFSGSCCCPARFAYDVFFN
jgi:hypothetical protein